MCGIALHLNSSGWATPLDLELIRHRGPDSRGEWNSPGGHYCLGNTRLPIRELSTSLAHSPMQPPPGTWSVGSAGWGPSVVDRVKGMRAFAIYDAARKELFLARNRLGQKPLY